MSVIRVDAHEAHDLTHNPVPSTLSSPRNLIRAGDLGAIDKQYDVAASTACPSLDYIVVDTTTTAQRCVELLRRQSLGVATFLILEKQAHLSRNIKERAQPPQGGVKHDTKYTCHGLVRSDSITNQPCKAHFTTQIIRESC